MVCFSFVFYFYNLITNFHCCHMFEDIERNKKYPRHTTVNKELLLSTCPQTISIRILLHNASTSLNQPSSNKSSLHRSLIRNSLPTIIIYTSPPRSSSSSPGQLSSNLYLQPRHAKISSTQRISLYQPIYIVFLPIPSSPSTS